ncbi:MAG: acetate kinase [Gammaproteobacteria bacterium]|jgi:acetate kinase|nr:acetate kinase [Gammaproteobacteria bacterium]
MIVLTLNSGSTSIKLAVYDTAMADAPVRLESEHHSGGALDRAALLAGLLGKLRSPPDVAVHRVVHGGTQFTGPVRIDDSVAAEIAKLSELAPLHNPEALEWIAAARAVCGAGVAQVAAFDTAFFARLPRVAAEYALAARIGVDQGVRRYGFHGLAHEAMWSRWCELYPELPRGGRLITVQLGGGCSITAVDGGRPRDNSMGFSPLEGLVMATRSGDVDPAILPYLQRRLEVSSERLIDLLNHDCGLAGLSGKAANPGDLLADPAPASQFAVELYCYRLRKYVGAYLAVLGGCDGIVFGGGVGEHVPGIRARALAGMSWAGIELDPAANESACGAEAAIQSARSTVRIQVVPVNEELVMLRAAEAVMAAK